jgi:hypothetical protein
MTATGKVMLISGGLLGLVYLMLFSAASNGYGYMGYRGFHAGPSFWYFGGPTIYGDPSNRSGSVGGPNRMGGGPGSGK